jgi:hypothetical protein
MPNDAKSGLLEYQALLDVFEKDCGRPAATMAEVRYWASAQNRGHLEFRVKRRLLELLLVPISTCNNELAAVSLRRHGGGAFCGASPNASRP